MLTEERTPHGDVRLEGAATEAVFAEGPTPAPVVPRPAAVSGAAAARTAWRFVPSPARTAAETAVRVAGAAGRAETGARGGRAGRRDRRASRRRRSAAAHGRGRASLTAGRLLREVTRDEVVRALAERMRALARDDQFRLGELR